MLLGSGREGRAFVEVSSARPDDLEEFARRSQHADNRLESVLSDRAGRCAAGLFNVLWRMYWYVPQARRRARKDGVDSQRFATSMRRTMPRNSSLIFQTAVAVFTLVIAL